MDEVATGRVLGRAATIGQRLSALAAACALAACGGGGTDPGTVALPSASEEASPAPSPGGSTDPSPEATGSPSDPVPAPTSPDGPPSAQGDRRAVFVTGGGCYDTAEPECPRFDAAISDQAWTALVEGRLPPSAGQDDSIGCGGEYVDGVSLRVVPLEDAADPASSMGPHVGCLSDADPDDPAVGALLAAAAAGRTVVADGAWTGVSVVVVVGGGCGMLEDACPDPVEGTATSGPLFDAVVGADLTAFPLVGGPDDGRDVGGCGGAPADGEGVLVTVRRTGAGVGQSVEACLEEIAAGTLRREVDALVTQARG